MSFCLRDNGFAPNALWNYAYNFDGSTNYLRKTSNLTGLTDSSRGILSIFSYVPASYVTQSFLFGTAGICEIGTNGTSKLYISVNDGAGNTYTVISTGTPTTAQWNHFLISWDTNFTSGNKLIHMYANGVDLLPVVDTDSAGAFNIDYSAVTAWTLGATSTASNKYTGCFGQVFFYPGQYLDFSNSSNRDKFQSSNDPIFIGRSGENPIGTAPLVYLNSSVDNIGLNSGSGGNFDSVNGTFTNCASTP